MTHWPGDSRNFSLGIRVAEGVQPTRLAQNGGATPSPRRCLLYVPPHRETSF